MLLALASRVCHLRMHAVTRMPIRPHRTRMYYPQKPVLVIQVATCLISVFVGDSVPEEGELGVEMGDQPGAHAAAPQGETLCKFDIMCQW